MMQPDPQDGPRFTCPQCKWSGHLSKHSINCPICFTRLREPIERKDKA